MTETENIGPNYIGADELVFNNDKELGIYSGGFSVKSIMMKAGMSPIMTLNREYMGGSSGSEKVSDLFNDLVVPSWALSYNDRMVGGKYNERDHHKKSHDTRKDEDRDDDDDTEDEDDIVSDDLHDKLLELVKEHNAKVKGISEDIKGSREKKEPSSGGKKRSTRRFLKGKKETRMTRKYRKN